MRVTLKLAYPSAMPGILQQEADVLTALQQSATQEAAYFGERLPKPVAIGKSLGPYGEGQELLLLQHPTGFWGSLGDVHAYHPSGVEPRHVVWMWRRVLEVLAFVHQSGWVHGELALEHLLVHPGDHGVLIIGWCKAERAAAISDQPLHQPTAARDLTQIAWSMRALLCGQGDITSMPAHVPGPLASLLERCCEDPLWSSAQGAHNLNRGLREAARQAFGAPRFVPFSPTA